jgi:TPR repeat protein
MRLLNPVVVMLVCAAGPAVAGPFDDGLTAAQKGDYATAPRLWRPLAERGDASAQNNLGAMYANGEGVPKDGVLAYMWLNLAAAKSDARAIKNRGHLASKMTPAQIAEAQRLAREWKRKLER